MIHLASYRELNETAVRLDKQRTKAVEASATGRARKNCWLLESDWTRAGTRAV